MSKGRNSNDKIDKSKKVSILPLIDLINWMED